MHTVLGLQEIALVITAALFCGLLLERFRQPAILGYILAGVILGPSGIAYIEDVSIIQLFADFGILMVLFVVGLSLDLRSFKRTMGISLSVVCGQIVISLCIAFTLNAFMQWSLGFSLLLAFVLALSSTAVAVKMLEASQELNTDVGRLTLGVLIAQDLAIVPMILILRDLDHGIQWVSLSLKIFVALGILSAFVWWLSRPRKVPLFVNFSAERPELPSLVSLSFCFGFATVSGFIGLSVAYGAFLAGLILGNLKERAIMLQVIMPIYSVLVMTFFLSVGLFINISFIWAHLWLILALSLGIIVFKTLINFGLLRALRQPWPTTFLAGVMLSQMGEFAFLLISIGWDSRVLSPFAQQMLITLTAISLAISPLWVMLYGKMSAYHLRAQATFQQTLDVYVHLLGGWAEYLFSPQAYQKKGRKTPKKP
ncbi:cation/H(+) antiporter [bacterium NHP-B]|nr:cation/H(+) antiporter [bacterium NHP-B]